MINYYQPFLLPFLQRQTYRLPDGLTQTYFLSFEDALWVLLRKRAVPKGSIILIPDFYCIDVADNIRAHGYRVEFYPLDDQFRISEKELRRYLIRHHPAILIVFHACGITSTLRESLKLLLQNDTNIIIIEDAVQQLVHPEYVTLYSSRHFLIDSLRKVSPLPGSFLYRRNDSPDIRPDQSFKEWGYIVASHINYLLFYITNSLGTLLHNSKLITYAHEHMLSAHDDLIGDSHGGYGGNPIFVCIHRHFDFEKIQRIKETQASLYKKSIRTLIGVNPMWYEIMIPNSNCKDLHAYPIGIRHTRLLLMMKYIQSRLHTNGIPIWFKFTDSPWSQKRGVLFLPLGFHIHQKDIDYIMKTLASLDRNE